MNVPPRSIRDSLRVICHEAARSPWICLRALHAQGDAELSAEAPGAGATVLVLGGFLSHPLYYAPLGRILGRRGHDVYFDDAFNAQPLGPHVAKLAERVDAIVDRAGAPLRIVGHSLGGIQAMAVLADRPWAVAQVIAVASPVAGGARWQPLQRFAERVLRVRTRDARALLQRLAPLVERITTISSPQDPIAPPAACTVAGATNVVLSTLPRPDRTLASHGGVIFMRTAVRIILSALAEPAAAALPARCAV
jgi:pimeloyl-ACP methyl ester carboxylesterase